MGDILDFDPPCVPLHFNFYQNGAFAHNLFHTIIFHEFFSNIDGFIGVKGFPMWSHVLSCLGINDPFAHDDCIKFVIHCKCIYSYFFHFQLLHCLHYLFHCFFFWNKNMQCGLTYHNSNTPLCLDVSLSCCLCLEPSLWGLFSFLTDFSCTSHVITYSNELLHGFVL